MTFAELPIGARFKWFGKIYTKIAPSMAEEEATGHGFIFGYGDFKDDEHEVELLTGETANPS